MTYNVQTHDTIIVIEAIGFEIMHGGVLVFRGESSGLIRAFNNEEWKEVWRVD